jgi:N-acetylmuramoyl-L-alanine amidase CwlA
VIEITEDLLRPNSPERPRGNRPGVIITPTFVVIHRTGNPGATAEQNARYFDTETNDKTFASTHYVVDADHIIRCIPENEMAYHCVGQNKAALGVEICEPLDAATRENALDLLVDILLRHDWSWGSEYVKPHAYFDPKNRPHDPFAWALFKAGLHSEADLFEPRLFYTELRDRLAARGGRAA